MAIDTRAKRASAIGVGIVSVLSIFPSGTIDQGQRQTSAHSYSGILASAPVIDTEDCFTRLNGFINDNAVQLTGGITDTTMRAGFIDPSVVQLQGFIDDVTRLEGDICC